VYYHSARATGCEAPPEKPALRRAWRRRVEEEEEWEGGQENLGVEGVALAEEEGRREGGGTSPPQLEE
jgi:hypothetical protein